MICTNLNVLYIIWMLALIAFMGYNLVLISNFMCSWRPEWQGRFEKLQIHYQENGSWRDPKATKFIRYFWQRRYQELPDQSAVRLGEKLRFWNIVMSPIVLLLTACIWLLPEVLCH